MMPWEPPEYDAFDANQSADMPDIPPALRRDANNKAPFMLCNYPKCDGGPSTGYCMNACKAVHPTLPAFMDAPVKVHEHPGHYQPAHGFLSPVTNPPATTQEWLPPWASKS